MSNHYVEYLKSTYNAGDPSSILGLERTSGEGIGYPLQYSWASLVVQTIKNPPALWETSVWSLVGKIPWRRTWQPTSVLLPGKFHRQRSLAGYSPWGHKDSQRVRHYWVPMNALSLLTAFIVLDSVRCFYPYTMIIMWFSSIIMI